MADPTVDEIITRQGELEDDRKPFEEVWSDIVDYIIPRRTQTDENAPKGVQNDEKIYDGTAPNALKRLSDGLQGQLISSNYKWFAMRMEQPGLMEIPVIRQWLQILEPAMYGLLGRSNFYLQMSEYFMDAGGFGTATIYSTFDRRHGRINFSTRHPKEIFLSQDQYGEIDGVTRRYNLSAKNWVDQFGSVDSEIERMADVSPETEFPCLHAVYARKDRDPNKQDALNMPWGSQYIDPMHKKVVRKSGYFNNPYHTWRFYKNSAETYGRSPSWNALPDAKALNEYAKTGIWAAQMSVQPPMWIPEDLRGKVRFVPGGNTYGTDPNNIPKPLNTDIRYGVGIEREERTRRQIQDAFMTDFFLLPNELDTPQRTAFETRTMKEEKTVALSPTINGLESEALDSILTRVFDIGMEERMLPPPPPILLQALGGASIKIDYMGPLAQLIRQFFRNQPYRNTLQEMAPVFQLQPATMDIYNWDNWGTDVGEANDLPVDSMRTPQQVAQIRQARLQAQEQQRQLDAAEQAGKAVPGLNQPVQPGSVLEQMDR